MSKANRVIGIRPELHQRPLLILFLHRLKFLPIYSLMKGSTMKLIVGLIIAGVCLFVVGYITQEKTNESA